MKYVDENPTVYWAERTVRGWEVLSGFYLGTYNTRFGEKHIVTLGGITCCVVRHLPKFYAARKEAEAVVAEAMLKELRGEE